MNPQPTRAAFTFIFITVALDMIALGIMIPVLPKLLVEFKGGDVAAAAAVSGVFGFIWAAMQFFFSPVLGSLSDRFGRRPVILLSNLGLGLDYLLMAVAPNLGWLFVGRLISGVTSASFPTAAAYISDVTPPEQRAARFGMLGAAFGLGFIIGPAIGGVLGGVDLRLPFWVAGAVSLLNTAYGYFILPESHAPDKRAPFRWAVANPLGSLKLLGSHAGLLALAGAAFLYFLAHEVLPSMFVLYTDYRYGWRESKVGLVLALVGISSMIVSATLIGPVVKKLGERGAVLAGLAFGTIGFGLYAVASTGSVFMWGIPFIGLWGITGPAMQSLMSRRLGPGVQGQLQGAISSMRGIAGMMGPPLFTQTFAYFISVDAPLALPGSAFLLATALIAMSLVVAWFATQARS